MEKRTIICNTTSTEQIIGAAKQFFISNGYEIQDIMTPGGVVGIQARKTNFLRKVSGTSYALQVIVEKKGISEYEVTAGWGEWLGKSAVVAIATFVAFGFLIVPATVGIVNQAKLPKKALDNIGATVSAYNPVCAVYGEAK